MDKQKPKINHRTPAPPCGTRKSVRRNELDGIKIKDMCADCQEVSRAWNRERQRAYLERKNAESKS